MKTLEAKIRIKLVEAIENVFEDLDILDELLDETDNMSFPNGYSDRMTDAAIAVLFAIADTKKFLKEQGELKGE
jgi:hypothetical protein